MEKIKKANHPEKYCIYNVITASLFICLPLLFVLVFNQNKQPGNTRAYAAGSGKDLYGIAAGDALGNISITDLNRSLDDYKVLGAQWVRFDFDWATIQSDGITNYNWASFDAAVGGATARGINVLGIIDYTPQWELAAGCTSSYFCPPKSATDYANFAALVAARYAPLGVHNWEIWNEPNAGNGKWMRFTPAAYTALLKAAYPAIKQADPNAFVLTGGTAPAATDNTDFSPIDWLSAIYQNGGQGYFDAVAHHPYCYGGENSTFNCPKTVITWSAWSQMRDTNPSLRSVMTANGDQNKKIWATEFGAPTGGGTADYALPVTEAQQAQMVTDAYTLFSSYSWSGPLFWYTYKDPCTTTTSIECYFGLVRADYSPKPVYAVYQNLATNAAPPVSAPIPTSIPTTIAAPTAIPASIYVSSLSERGTSSTRSVTLAFVLQTTGSIYVNNLIVAIRDKNDTNFDLPVRRNTTLTGSQSFRASRRLPAGSYVYWVAYNIGDSWINLSPTKSFALN